MLKHAPVSLALSLVLCGLIAAPASGQAPGKSQYSFINPTPRSQWRPMSADAPAVTDSPFTVDAGAWQVELSVFEWTKDGGNEALRWAPFLLKTGILNNLDLQLLVEPYVRREFDVRSGESGFGDLTFRAKWNLWGNDGGKTALALIPFIVAPTSSGNVGAQEVEGGIAIPFQIDLNRDWSLRLMPQFAGVYNEEKDRHDFEYLQTLAVYWNCRQDWTVYGELVGVYSGDTGTQYALSLGLGLQWELTDDVSWELGTLTGLDGGADDFSISTGFSFRF